MIPELITSQDDLLHLAQRLGREPRLAFDTEAASFHRYADRVYLIQVSSERETAVIDPLAVTDLTAIGGLLADPNIEVLFHDADYDLRSLYRDYGFRAHRLFDTRIAAQLLGEPGVGLGALLKKYFGLILNKNLQRADWSQRPLTREMIEYAAADTSHLPRLRDALERQLAEKGRLDWALEEFRRQETVQWAAADVQDDAYLRLKGAKVLPSRAQQVLRAVHRWREDRARALDRASFRVLPNESLLALARAAPTEPASLKKTPGFPASAAERYGAEIVEAIRSALQAPETEWPRHERTSRPRPDHEAEERLDRLKHMRNERAKELGLEAGVLCANSALQALARAGSFAAGDGGTELRAWQQAALGEERILAALVGSSRGQAT